MCTEEIDKAKTKLKIHTNTISILMGEKKNIVRGLTYKYRHWGIYTQLNIENNIKQNNESNS